MPHLIVRHISLRLNEFPLRENCLTRFLFARFSILWGFVYFCIQKISLHETFIPFLMERAALFVFACYGT